MRYVLLCALVIAAGLPVSADMQAGAQADKMIAAQGSALTWNKLELPGFAPGLMIAAVQGDSAVADQPYTLRLKFPAGYAFPAHYHPKAENLTVMSGTFLLAHGEKVDNAALKNYAPGDYLYIPGKMPHYGRVKGETVVQLHGIGPFEVILVTPAKK